MSYGWFERKMTVFYPKRPGQRGDVIDVIAWYVSKGREIPRIRGTIIPMNPQPILVLITVPSESLGQQIAQALLTQRLAACVSLLPGLRSFYTWEGAIQSDAETLLLIKTTQERFQTLQTTVQALHPYQVPEIIALPIQAGLESYLAWLAQVTKPE